MSESKSFSEALKALQGISKELSSIQKTSKDLVATWRDFGPVVGGLSSAAGGTKGGQSGLGGGGKGVMPNSFPGGMPAKSGKMGGGTAATSKSEKWGTSGATPREERVGLGSFSAEGMQKISSSGRGGMRAVSNAERINDAVNKVNGGGGSFSDRMIAGAANRAAKIGDSAIVKNGGMLNANAFAALPPDSQERIGSSMYGISDALTLFKNLSVASGSFMPDINGTMTRASKYYNATTYGGNQMSRKAVENATYGTMQGLNGITSAGSDAATAQFLAARGMGPSTDANGVYQQTLRTVSNAARYMNISNEDAARSVEGLTNARGSADMLRNFGIYTADLKTGKEKTQTQIFEELAGRLTAGRGKATVEQTQKSIRRGALGVTVDAFFGGDQQSAQMFKQYMIDRASGNPMDLSANKRKSGPAANENPLMSQMTIAGKQSGAFGTAEDEYIAGIKTATGALSALTDAAGGIAKVMGGANALIQTLMGNQQFKGAVGGLTSIVDFSSKGLGGIFNAARQMNPAGWTEAGIIGASMGLTLGTAAGIGIGTEALTKTTAGSGTGAANANLGTPTGMNGMSTSSNGLNGKGAGSPEVSGSFSMGDYSKIPGMDSTSASNTSSAPDTSGKLLSIDWLSSYRINSPYGESDHAGGAHRGTDYGLREGTDVKAVGDGVVYTAITGKGNMWQEYLSRGTVDGGNTVKIQHTAADGKKYFSMYCHLSEVLVTKGQQVTKGQIIGKSGNTGTSTGAHLHLEFQDEKGKAISPTDALALTGGSSTSPQSALQFGLNQETLTAGMAFTKKLAQLPTQATNAFNILQNLYSGDQSKILSAITAMAPAGITSDLLSNYLTSADPSTIASNAASSAAASAAGGGGAVNNVSITVQVPDVTSADALKFAQMVRGYLQNDTLMSTTGSV